jgi:hypothetical protein
MFSFIDVGPEDNSKEMERNAFFAEGVGCDVSVTEFCIHESTSQWRILPGKPLKRDTITKAGEDRRIILNSTL